MSSGTFFSDAWYRVATLKPRLADHARAYRHRYRGAVWYVVEDRIAGRVHRLSPAGFYFVQLLDGQRTVEDAWLATGRAMREDTPGQDDAIQLLAQLHSADLLQSDVMPDTAELFARYGKQTRGTLWRNLLNPLTWRKALWDPDRFLVASLPYAKLLFSQGGMIVWLVVVSFGGILAVQHWRELTENITDRMLATENLLLLAATFPAVKFIHEMAHAYATRVRGGEVHEMGIMFLVFMPVPYVDASAASRFPQKTDRALVGAAGMMAELFLASLALMLWLVIEPGGVRAILFNVMAIAGISTVIFNGNPLLRFDGYYMLGDLIESPNLGVRANRYWGYLVEKYLFAIPNLAPYEIAAGERKWLLWYAPSAFAYRLVVACAIALYLASEFFVLGVLLGLASLFGMLVKPLLKGLAYVLIGPRAASKRPRVISVTCVAVAIAAILVGATPAPLRTQSEGVIWLPIQAEVRAGTAGFIEELLLDPGKTVAVGQPIARCSDPLLEVQIKVAKARVIELERQRAAELVSDRVQAAVTAESLRRERARLQRAEQRAEELLIRSPVAGRLMLAANPQDLPGRYLRHGELLAYVVDGSTTQARVIVDQNDVDLVRRTVQAVEVRFADRPEDIYPTRIVREVPQAEAELPSAALGTAGGGRRLLDPEDPEGRRALGSVFQFDVALPPRYTESTFTPYGARVHVRFSHDWEPLGTQWARRLRQLFLSRLNV